MDSIWTEWHLHPDVLIGLALLQGGYLLGIGPIRERYGLAEASDPRQTATFTLGVLVIFFALLSPLHRISNDFLFSAHMLQHVLLTLVAPPLLILGTPDWLIRRILRPDPLFIAARIATYPVVAFLLFNIIFSIWHLPALYNLSVTVHAAHVFEHVLFMGSATLMWWPIASTMPELPRLSYPLQMLYLFLLSIAQLIIFAPITFATAPLYEWYANAPRILALDAVADQQIGAIIMKIGGGILLIALIIVAFFKWYSREQEKTRREMAEAGYETDA